MRSREVVRMGGANLGVLRRPLTPGECDALGSYDANTDTITIYDGLDAAKYAQVFGHEWMHHILERAAFNALTQDQKEALCDAVGDSLASLLAQNPGFVRRLVDELKGG